MIFPELQHGCLKESQVRDTVQAELIKMGWTLASWSIYAFSMFTKNNITLQFKYKGESYSSHRQNNPSHKPTWIWMSFRGKDYKDISRKISYKKFTFEWVEQAFKELSDDMKTDQDAQAQSDAYKRYHDELHTRAKMISESLDMGLFEIGGYKHTPMGVDRFSMALDDLTEADVRELGTLYKKLKSHIDTSNDPE